MVVWITVLLCCFHYELDLPSLGLIWLVSIVTAWMALSSVAYSLAMTLTPSSDRTPELAITAGLIAGPMVGIASYLLLLRNLLKSNRPQDEESTC